MRVVTSAVKLVVLSEVRAGETFRWHGMYYIRPCSHVRSKYDIGGMNLETGDYVTNSDVTRVERVQMEAREL